MRRSRLPALLIATLPALGVELSAGPSAASGDPGGRYPVWPSEIDRVAAPLRDPTMMSETARLAALDELGEFATELIVPDLELALTDPSPEVRKRALELCATRQILACVDEAELIWEGGEGGVRLMALELLSQDPTPEHLDLVYEAMRDPNDLIREQAIMLLVDAPLSAERATEARRELVAQLGDFSARVRRTAARSLGRLGPGEGALALVRLLDDIDPNVATAAAQGLGQLADARTAPALLRALENPNNQGFASAALSSLARLPGADIDEALLELLDSPPRNVRRVDVARAIGGRPEPGPTLIAGLVARMRDPDLRDPSTQALLWLGDRAVAQLEAATERGLEPDIALEVERLLAARRLEPTPRVELQANAGATLEVGDELPSFDARDEWFRILGDPDAVEAGAVLGERPPEWFEGALVWQLERAASAAQVRPWLAALALAPEPVLGGSDHSLSWARVASWAQDRSSGVESRCLATLALGRALGTRHADVVVEELRELAAAHVADVRGCAALTLARFGEDPVLEALMADPSPRVRAATALGLRMIRKPAPVLRSRLALQSDRDSEMRARTSAALALRSRDPQASLALVRGRPTSVGLSSSGHWDRFEFEGEAVDVPMLGGGRGWAIVPLAGAVPAAVDTVMAIPAPQYGPYPDYYHM